MKRILAVFLVFAICFSMCALPVAAVGEVRASKAVTFWDAFARGLSPAYAFLSAYLEKGKTPETATDQDWANAYGGFGGDGRGTGFVDKVNTTLGTTQIGKNGYYIYAIPWDHKNGSDGVTVSEYKVSGHTVSIIFKASTADYHYVQVVTEFTCPADGYYTFMPEILYTNAFNRQYYGALPGQRLGKKAGFRYGQVGFELASSDMSLFSSAVLNFRFFFEPVTFAPDTFTDPVGGAASRSGAYSGNFGYYGKDGNMIVGENIKLVNETNNTVFNPVTNKTSNVTDWTYDYSNRTYTVTLDTGTKQTISYGDTNVVIKEGDVTYNVYYVTPDSGGGTGGDPTPCVHDYVGTITTAPTCLVGGSKTLTCSKCKDTKTEKLPALGHTWVVNRTVQTSYDANGVLVQQGYTIYQCSACNEQYKDIDGTGPPGGGGGTPGKETLWDKIKNFLGAMTDGVFNLITTLIGTLIDGFTSLVLKLSEKLGAVIDVVLNIFAQIPKLFKGFIDFLTAGFAFFPPEVVMIIEFGLLAVMIVGLAKFLFFR